MYMNIYIKVILKFVYIRYHVDCKIGKYIYVITFSIKEKRFSDTNEICMYAIYTCMYAMFNFIKFIKMT